MTEPEGAIVADANTSELTRLRARVRELEAALELMDDAIVAQHTMRNFSEPKKLDALLTWVENDALADKLMNEAREAARRTLEATDAND